MLGPLGGQPKTPSSIPTPATEQPKPVNDALPVSPTPSDVAPSVNPGLLDLNPLGVNGQAQLLLAKPRGDKPADPAPFDAKEGLPKIKPGDKYKPDVPSAGLAFHGLTNGWEIDGKTVIPFKKDDLQYTVIQDKSGSVIYIVQNKWVEKIIIEVDNKVTVENFFPKKDDKGNFIPPDKDKVVQVSTDHSYGGLANGDKIPSHKQITTMIALGGLPNDFKPFDDDKSKITNKNTHVTFSLLPDGTVMAYVGNGDDYKMFSIDYKTGKASQINPSTGETITPKPSEK